MTTEHVGDLFMKLCQLRHKAERVGLRIKLYEFGNGITVYQQGTDKVAYCVSGVRPLNAQELKEFIGWADGYICGRAEALGIEIPPTVVKSLESDGAWE